MAPRPSPIAAAERAVLESRSELRHAVRRLRRRLSRPSSLAAAAAAGAILGVSLQRRGRTGAIAGMLAWALIRHAVKQLLVRNYLPMLLPKPSMKA